MIIRTKLEGVDKVHPFWVKKKSNLPVREQHKIIIDDAFPNVTMAAKKKTGKSTCSIYIILKHFMTKKTHLIIFSSDLDSDKDHKKAFRRIEREYPDNFELYPAIYADDGTSILQQKMQESKEQFLRPNKTGFEYPRYIFYFDDLDVKTQLRSSEIDELFKTNRHFGILNILCCHDIKHIGPTARGQTNLLILFRGLSRNKLKDLWEWTSLYHDFKTFIRVYNDCTVPRKKVKEGEVFDPKPFMMIDMDTKEVRCNLDEIITVK